MSREHVLKTWPSPFAGVLSGRKRHEVRVNDRAFSVGDTLVLCEWEPREDGGKCTVIGCSDTSDSRWWARDPNGSPRPICDGHGENPNVYLAGRYTGRELRVVVTYITPGGAFDLPHHLCVMSIEPERAA